MATAKKVKEPTLRALKYRATRRKNMLDKERASNHTDTVRLPDCEHAEELAKLKKLCNELKNLDAPTNTGKWIQIEYNPQTYEADVRSNGKPKDMIKVLASVLYDVLVGKAGPV